MNEVGAVVVMGVSGAGKSTIGSALAERMGAVFVDADDLHSREARARMGSGVPLTDQDRIPWLTAVGAKVRDIRSNGRAVVVACSALRRSYRDILRAAVGEPLSFLHLTGSTELLTGRLTGRSGHFMPATLLSSQLETLEQLEPDEVGIVVSIDATVDEIVEGVVRGIGLAV